MEHSLTEIFFEWAVETIFKTCIFFVVWHSLGFVLSKVPM
jgi:hypothetical protein